MKSHRLYLTGFVLTSVFVVSQLYLLIPVTYLLTSFYERTSTDIALLTSYFGFSYASGFLVWGGLSDRFGRKLILLIGLACLTVTTALLSIYNVSYETVLALRIMQGFAASAFPPVALAYISESFPSEMRLKGIAWMSTAFLLSALIGQWVGRQLIEESITNVMEVFTVLYLISVILNAYLPTRKILQNSESNVENEKVRFINVVTSTITNFQLFRLYIIALSLLSSFVSLYAYLVNTQSYFLPAGLTVSELRVYAIPCMFAPIFVAQAIRRLGADKLVFASLLIASLSLFSHSLVSGVVSFVILHLLFVVAIAATVPSVISLVAMNSDHINRGFAISVYTFTLFVGASVGALMPVMFGDNTVSISVAMLSVAVIFNIPLNRKLENNGNNEDECSEGLNWVTTYFRNKIRQEK